MNTASQIILALVLLLAAAAVLHLHASRRKGRGLSCEGCALRDCCNAGPKASRQSDCRR